MTTPKGLRAGGRALWIGITKDHPELDSAQKATLQTACRQLDRVDQMASTAAVGQAGPLRTEREASLAMARLLAALRLPDAKGNRPQHRQVRGVQKPTRAKLSSLDRARLAKGG